MWMSLVLPVRRCALLSACALLLGSGLISSSASAQHRHFTSYSLEEGLPQSQVVDLLQDERGYLWMALYGGGVARFDGHSFRAFTIEDGLPDNSVVKLHEDSSGTLWFGTKGGLARYDGKGIRTYTSEDGLPQSEILDLVGGKDGRLAVQTAEGIFTYDGATFRPLAPNQIRGMSQGSLAAHGDTLWIEDGQSLYRSVDTSLTAVPLQKAGSGVSIEDYDLMSVGPSGRLWVLTNEGLFVREGEARFKPVSGTEDLVIYSLLVSSEDEVWLGTKTGLYRHADGTTQRFGTQLAGTPVRALLRDRERNLWVGTSGKGLFKHAPNPFDHFTSGDGLSGKLVWDVTVGPNGSVWAGGRGGLRRYDGSSFERVPGPGGEPLTGTVGALASTQAGALWIGIDSRLLRYDGTRYTTYVTADGTAFRFIRHIVEGPSGSVWFAPLNSGLLEYDGTRLKRYTTADGLPSARISAFAVDKNGRLWVGGGNDIHVWSGSSFSSLGLKNHMEGGTIQALTIDADGYAWIGTEGGVYVSVPTGGARTDSLVSFTTADGLNDNATFSLHIDQRGFLWATTRKGINRLDIQHFKGTGTMPIRSYGKKDGFLGVEVSNGAVCETSDGHLWFGTLDGVTRYDPDRDRINSVQPPPRLTNVQPLFGEVDLSSHADGRSAWEALPTNLALPYDKNHLLFRFVGLSYTIPEQVTYKYKMEGLDEQWTAPTKQRQAAYSSLPPGSYTFKVKAANNDGVWSKEPATYSFTIHPPFWRTNWFYALCVLAGIGLVVGFIRWRTYRLRRRQEELEETVADRTRELRERKNRLADQIDTLKGAMARIEDGDLDVAVDVQREDELGELAHSFNQMVEDLRERSLLQQHVGEHTLEMVRSADDRSASRPGEGRIREVAILFTDIRGSTEMIGRTDPKSFVEQLNRTFDRQAEAAARFGGAIDKFVGDAMIALFMEEEPLKRALQCSVEIQCGFRADSVSRFFEGLGIGVNYGPVLMGNIGGEERLDYSVIGPEVNLGARLCEAAGPGQVLVREELVERHGLSGNVETEPVGEQSFKGFEESFRVAEVVYECEER